MKQLFFYGGFFISLVWAVVWNASANIVQSVGTALDNLESSSCSKENYDKINGYCMMLSGKELKNVVSCVREKIPEITVNDSLSSFTFALKSEDVLSSDANEYTVSLAMDKLFCGVLDSNSLSVKQNGGSKICYKDIDRVVLAFSEKIMEIKDNCFNKDIFYQTLDAFVKGTNDTKLIIAWKFCLFKDTIIERELNSKLKDLLKDCHKNLYCKDPGCMQKCCSSYKEGQVSKTCCKAVNGKYTELSGNKASCCTDCGPKTSFNLKNYMKELFGIKTAYAQESGSCIVSCKEGYEMIDSECCPSDWVITAEDGSKTCGSCPTDFIRCNIDTGVCENTE